MTYNWHQHTETFPSFSCRLYFLFQLKKERGWRIRWRVGSQSKIQMKSCEYHARSKQTMFLYRCEFDEIQKRTNNIEKHQIYQEGKKSMPHSLRFEIG